MTQHELLTALLWFAPLVLILAYLRVMLHGSTRKLFDIALAFVMAGAFFALLRGTAKLHIADRDMWLQIAVIGLALLPFLLSQREAPTPQSKTKRTSLFFVAHSDILGPLLLWNGLLTVLLFALYQHNTSAAWSVRIGYAVLYTLYLLGPLYALYWLAFCLWPKAALRPIIWLESLRVSVFALDLVAFISTGHHLPSAQAREWLLAWQVYPRNDRVWPPHRTLVVVMFGFFFVLGMQILLQWLYRRLVRHKQYERGELCDTAMFSRWWRRGLYLGMTCAVVFAALWIGRSPYTHGQLTDTWPLARYLLLDLRWEGRENFAQQLQARQSLFQPPKTPLKPIDRQSRRPDIVWLVMRPLSSDALQAQRMPQWSKILAEHSGLTSFNHQAGPGGNNANGLKSLLHSVSAYRLDLLQTDAPWPLRQLQTLGYRLEIAAPHKMFAPAPGPNQSPQTAQQLAAQTQIFAPHNGWHQVTKIPKNSNMTDTASAIQWLSLRLQHHHSQISAQNKLTGSAESAPKSTHQAIAATQATATQAVATKAAATKAAATKAAKTRVMAVERNTPDVGSPSAKALVKHNAKSSQQTLGPNQRQPLFLVVVADLMDPHISRHADNCKHYNAALRDLDGQLAGLWATTLRHRVQQELVFMWTGESGWMMQDTEQSTAAANWLEYGSTPLALWLPNTASRQLVLSGHPDIFPTIFAYMGLRTPAHTYSDGHNLLSHAHAPFQTIAQPLTQTPGIALISPMLRLFLTWDHTARLTLTYATAFGGGYVSPAPEQWQPLAAQFQKNATRFAPKLQMWSTLHYQNRLQPPIIKQLLACKPGLPTHDGLLSYKPLFTHPSGAKIGEHLEILGYDLDHQSATVDQLVRIRIVARVLHKWHPKWRIFAHLNATGWFLNRDKQLFQTYPPTQWKQGDIVAGTLEFMMPNHKEVSIHLGLWDKAEGRLPIHNAPNSQQRLHLLSIFKIQQSSN